MENSDAEVRITTPFGPLFAKGQAVFIVLALAGLTGVILWENFKRSVEHDQMQCLNKLVIYQHERQHLNPHGEILFDPYAMPPELWNCIPQFLIKGPR